MHFTRTIIILSLILNCALGIAAEDGWKQIENEGNKAFEELAKGAFGGSEKERIAIVGAMQIQPPPPRALSLLFYLAKDSSVHVRRAAIEGLGNIANTKMDPDFAKAICTFLRSELKYVLEKEMPQSDDEFLLPALCVFALHQLYEYQPVASKSEFRQFETESYIEFLGIIGSKYHEGSEYRKVFGEMFFNIRDVEGLQNVFPTIASVLKDLPDDDACSALLVVKQSLSTPDMEKAQCFYHKWLGENGEFFEALEKRARETKNANQAEETKEALEYIEEVIFPIIHKKAK